MARNRALLADFGGSMKRLRETYDILNSNWPVAWSPDALISAMQTGDRITYDPNTAFAELSGLRPKLAALPHMIDSMRATKNSPGFATPNSDSNRNERDARLAKYNELISTAVAHIEDISETRPRASMRTLSSEQPKTQGP